MTEEENGHKEELERELDKKSDKLGKLKHERLKEERFVESKHKEKLRDFRKNISQKGKHIFDKKRKDKFLGGIKGRRGG